MFGLENDEGYPMRLRGWKRYLAFGLMTGSVAFLGACNIGLGAGFGGGLLTLLLLLVFVGGTSTAQGGCTESVEPCLSPPAPDTGWTTDGGDNVEDTENRRDTLSPCLSPPARDTGRPGDERDVGTDTGGDADGGDAVETGTDATDSGTDATDTTTGGDAADSSGETGETVGQRDSERREILDRLDDRLPDDVVERLSDDEEPA